MCCCVLCGGSKEQIIGHLIEVHINFFLYSRSIGQNKDNRKVNHQTETRMATNNSGNLRDDGNYTAAGKGQVCIPTSDKNLQFRKIKAITANQVCFDCPATRPTWASVTYGTFGLDAADSLTGVIRKCSCLTLFLNILVSLCDSL